MVLLSILEKLKEVDLQLKRRRTSACLFVFQKSNSWNNKLKLNCLIHQLNLKFLVLKRWLNEKNGIRKMKKKKA